jgi:hypothetical protein
MSTSFSEPVVVPPPAATSPAPTRTPRSPARPLVDRDDELAALQAVLHELSSGAACVAIEGEAGIGKTRIAEEFLEYVAGRGARTITVSCAENETGLTCGPLTDLLRDATATDRTWIDSLPPVVLAEIGRIVPELAGGSELPPTASLESPGAQARFLDGLFAAVAAVVAGPSPGVVVIDDLHWADPTTLDVLCRGLRRHRGAPVLVVVAWRTELVGHDHPVRRLLREEAVTTLSPARLTRDGGMAAEHGLAVLGPPRQEPLSRQEQVIARVVATVVVKVQLPVVRHSLPPQSLNRVHQRRCRQWRNRLVAAHERGGPFEVEAAVLGSELDGGGAGNLFTERSNADSVPVDHPGDLALVPQDVSVLHVTVRPARRAGRSL